MQSRDGGWAAFDVNNLEYYLNNIPFSDHGALLDPPTEDVTARCVSMLAQLGETVQTSQAVADGVAYLRRTQFAEGSWYGRWGLNYIYGTWSVLCALNAAGVDHQDPVIRKAADWLVSIQNEDGGWGEDATSYRLDYKGFEDAPTTASQTAWALLGLMAAGEVGHPAVAAGRGVPKKHTDRKRAVGRAALHGNGLSSGILSALSWLLEVLSALGAGAVSKFEEHQQQGGRGRNVNLGAGDDPSVGNPIDPRPVFIVTGLVQEARIAAGPGMTVICSSSDPQQLRALLTVFDPSTIRGVISFGVAGGLDPTLRSGDVVVATEVLAGDTRWLAGLALNEELIASVALGRRRVVRGGLAGVEQMVVAQARKGRAAFGDGGCRRRYGKPYRRRLRGRGGPSICGAAGHQRSRLARVAGAGEIRDQAEWRDRPAQGAARRRAQSADAARAGLDRDRFQSRAAQPTRLSRLSAGRRGPRHGGSLTAASGPPPRRCTAPDAG